MFFVTRQRIERQNTSRPVHIDPKFPLSGQISFDVNEWDRNVSLTTPVVERIATPDHDIHTPGLFAHFNFGVPHSFSLYTLVCHTNINYSSPLHLPVAASSHGLSAHNLWDLVKSFWVIRVRLCLLGLPHFHSTLRQQEMFICRLGVKCKITDICQGKMFSFTFLQIRNTKSVITHSFSLHFSRCCGFTQCSSLCSTLSRRKHTDQKMGITL